MHRGMGRRHRTQRSYQHLTMRYFQGPHGFVAPPSCPEPEPVAFNPSDFPPLRPGSRPDEYPSSPVAEPNFAPAWPHNRRQQNEQDRFLGPAERCEEREPLSEPWPVDVNGEPPVVEITNQAFAGYDGTACTEQVATYVVAETNVTHETIQFQTASVEGPYLSPCNFEFTRTSTVVTSH